MVYADYAATHPYVKYPSSSYGTFLNPNANYAYKEKRLLSETENKVKTAIGAKSGKVVFGGTSSQLIENLMSAVDEQTNFRHVICSAYEHDSFFRYKEGTINSIGLLNRLLSAYDGLSNNPDQTFVLWQGVNNLTGEIFPVADIGNACHEYNAFYICDMTAMIGKGQIPANIDQWCDCAVWSGHKLGTELGIGTMWISDRLDQWLNGFKLHGTPNLAGALAMTQAVEDACDKVVIDKKDYHWEDLADVMYRTLEKANINYVMIPNQLVAYTYAINAIRLSGFNADALQQYLASKQIYVSIGGSACAEKHDYRVLNAYGLSNDEASEVIRVSFGEDSSVEDVEALVTAIKEFRDVYC